MAVRGKKESLFQPPARVAAQTPKEAKIKGKKKKRVKEHLKRDKTQPKPTSALPAGVYY